MPVKMINTRVGGAKWEMNTLPATTGLACLTQIGAIIGAPAGAAAGGLKADMKILDLDAGVMGDAVAKMTERLADPSVVDLVKTLISGAHRNDKAVDFDDYFAANYGELAQLLMWSMRENFGSFLGGNKTLESAVRKVEQSIRGT